MSNYARGEIDVELEGRPYVLRFSFNAMRELREHFKKPIQVYLTEKGENLDVEDIAQIFKSDLKAGGHDVTLEALFDMLDMPHMGYYIEKIGEAFGKANMGTEKLPDVPLKVIDPAQ